LIASAFAIVAQFLMKELAGTPPVQLTFADLLYGDSSELVTSIGAVKAARSRDYAEAAGRFIDIFVEMYEKDTGKVPQQEADAPWRPPASAQGTHRVQPRS
jgi:hypothetical protein